MSRPGRRWLVVAVVVVALAHAPTRARLVDLALGVADALEDDDV